MCSARVDPNAICTADVCFCWLQSSSCVPQLSFPTSAKTCGNSFPGWSTNVDSWCGELSCVHVKDQSCIGQRVLHPHSPTWLARAPSAVRPSPVALGRADPRWWPPRRGAARRWWPPCWPPPRTSMATPPAGHSTRPPRRASRRCAPPPPPVDGPSALPCILGQPPFWGDSVLTTVISAGWVRTGDAVPIAASFSPICLFLGVPQWHCPWPRPALGRHTGPATGGPAAACPRGGGGCRGRRRKPGAARRLPFPPGARRGRRGALPAGRGGGREPVRPAGPPASDLHRRGEGGPRRGFRPPEGPVFGCLLFLKSFLETAQNESNGGRVSFPFPHSEPPEREGSCTALSNGLVGLWQPILHLSRILPTRAIAQFSWGLGPGF